MKGTKAPALTSPWKIGFFVSLLLVALAIGVGFLLTRTFGIAWTWIAFDATSWKDIQFDMDAFLREMLPLIVLVPVFSLVSYFLITGAVRKYKRYLDSGFDYKNLIQSIRGLDDLSDERAIKKLSRHPELKELLLDVKKRADSRQAELADRERQINERAARLATEDGFNAEANVLLSAIISGRDGFGKELALSNAQLKKIEEAIRDNLLVAGGGAGAGKHEQTLAVFAEAASKLRADLQGITEDVTATEKGAREVENLARRAVSESASVEPDPARTGGASQAIGALDAVGQTLATVGEEARGIAINAAMQASNTGNSELATIAEAMQSIASRLSEVANRWAQASATARAAIGGAAPGLAGSTEASEASVEAVLKSASMWVERASILSDGFKKFERRYSQACSDIGVQMAGHSQESAEAAEDIAFEQRPAPTVAAPAAGADPMDANTGVFERQSLSPILDPSGGADADVDGLEKDPNPVAEVARDAGDRDAMFTDIPTAATEAEPPAEAAPTAPTPPAEAEVPEPGAMFEEIGDDSDPAPAQHMDAPQAPADFLEPTSLAQPGSATPVEAPAPQDGADDDGFVTDPAVGHPEPEHRTEADPEQAFQATAIDADEHDNAIDLYALGAVDYEPANAMHNG